MSAAPKAPPSGRRFLPLIIAAVLGLSYTGYRVYLGRLPYEWSGTVEARTISVGSRAGGRVKEVSVHEGDEVQAGQVLLTLEPGDLLAQRLQAQGQLNQVKANLDKLVKGARPEEIEQARARSLSASAALEQTKVGARQEQISAAQARLAAQEVAVDKANLDADRMHKLLAQGAAAQMEVDNADSAQKSAVATRNALLNQLDELKNGSRREELAQAAARAQEAVASEKLVRAGTRVEDIQAARGQVEAAQGRLDQINSLVDELEVRAPRASRVEALDLRPGDILAPNATAATLLEPDQLYVRIYVPETLLGHLREGAEVPVSVDSFSGREFKGVVEHINSVGEYSPRNLQTADERADQVFASRVRLGDGLRELRAGMAAFIRVPR